MEFPLIDGMSYFITPECAPENVLEVEGDNIDAGASIISSLHHGDNNQRFIATKITKKYFVLTAENSGKVVDVSDGKATDGTKIQIWDYNGTPAQLWKLKEAGDGYFTICSKINPDYCIDIPEQSPESGVKIQLFKRNNTPAKRFRLTPCPDAEIIDLKEEYRPLYEQWKAEHPKNKNNNNSSSGDYDLIDLALDVADTVGDVVDDAIDALFWWL